MPNERPPGEGAARQNKFCDGGSTWRGPPVTTLPFVAALRDMEPANKNNLPIKSIKLVDGFDVAKTVNNEDNGRNGYDNYHIFGIISCLVNKLLVFEG